ALVAVQPIACRGLSVSSVALFLPRCCAGAACFFFFFPAPPPPEIYTLSYTTLFRSARKVIQQLDQLSGGDARTLLGAGVLLARHRMYAEAIQHFQAALGADPGSDDARYNLAATYFQLHDYARALEMLQQVSAQAQNDDAYL